MPTGLKPVATTGLASVPAQPSALHRQTASIGLPTMMSQTRMLKQLRTTPRQEIMRRLSCIECPRIARRLRAAE